MSSQGHTCTRAVVRTREAAPGRSGAESAVGHYRCRTVHC